MNDTRNEPASGVAPEAGKIESSTPSILGTNVAGQPTEVNLPLRRKVAEGVRQILAH